MKYVLVPDPSTGFPGDPANPPCSTLYIRDTCNQDGSSCVASTNNLGRLCGAIAFNDAGQKSASRTSPEISAKPVSG